MALFPFFSPSIKILCFYFSNFQVVHNYGHGGYGISTAPGTSKYAVQLAKEIHRLSSRL